MSDIAGIVVILIIIVAVGYLLYQISAVQGGPTLRKSEPLYNYLQYEPIELPIRYESDLYWIDIHLRDPYGSVPDQIFSLIVDSGSDLAAIPSSACTECSGPRWTSEQASDQPIRRIQYEGGQNTSYQFAIGYSSDLRQNIQLAVMSSGSTSPDGNVINIFGLLNPSLQLHYLNIDFIQNQLRFLSSPSVDTGTLTWSPLQRLPYWAIPVSGISGVDWIILDTGSNFVIVDPRLPINGDFSFSVGTRQIRVPASLIRQQPTAIERSITVGNMVMKNYSWLFDMINQRVAILS